MAIITFIYRNMKIYMKCKGSITHLLCCAAPVTIAAKNAISFDMTSSGCIELQKVSCKVRQCRLIITSAKEAVGSVRFVRQSFWLCALKSNQPISLKLGFMIGPANRAEELINFWWRSVPGYGFRITFHFPHHCRMGGFRFISISHTIASRFSRQSATWLSPTR